MNHVLAQPLLLQGSDDEIASATDVSDDGENDMWVFSHAHSYTDDLLEPFHQ
jgi:hypothetical protein